VLDTALSHYRTPVEALYLCGSSSHSGGAITGSPGYNCANTITEDLKIERWSEPIQQPRWEG
jgi:phytoene dehydrogenase-like protein